ncbi:MAG: hypothetical protein LBO66_07625 [Deltaproteobacteria bacterium]|jgi:predicted nuclease of restriction endonuclease-like RecB superfamily|nr:hypothetical protein [Deltaproteobacteria bacterium]
MKTANEYVQDIAAKMRALPGADSWWVQQEIEEEISLLTTETTKMYRFTEEMGFREKERERYINKYIRNMADEAFSVIRAIARAGLVPAADGQMK